LAGIVIVILIAPRDFVVPWDNKVTPIIFIPACIENGERLREEAIDVFARVDRCFRLSTYEVCYYTLDVHNATLGDWNESVNIFVLSVCGHISEWYFADAVTDFDHLFSTISRFDRFTEVIRIGVQSAVEPLEHFACEQHENDVQRCHQV
jgi:hypothetical protein